MQVTKTRLATHGLIAACAIATAVACASQDGAKDERSASQAQGLLASSLAAYPLGTTVRIDYTDMQGAVQDWIGIYNVRTPREADTQMVAWKYTRGGAAGSLEFSGLKPGRYEARAYYDWPTGGFTAQQTSNAFDVDAADGGASGPSVTAPATSPVSGAPFQVGYSGMPGYPTDWISVAAEGSTPETVTRWAYTNGNITGSLSFNGLPAGTYVIRAFRDWAGTQSYTPIATATFPIGAAATGAAVTPPGVVAPATPFSVGFSGFPGTATDWVSVARTDQPNNQFVQFRYTGGATSGTLSFDGLAAGTYVARAYFNFAGTQSYTVQASTPFLVATGACAPASCPVHRTCQALLTAFPNNPSGVYTIDPDAAGAGAPVATYCRNEGANGWTMVYKVSEGNPGSPSGLWFGAPANEGTSAATTLGPAAVPYVSRIISSHWNANGVTLTRARAVVMNAGNDVKFMELNATGTNNNTWFAPGNLVSSSWTDLPSAGILFFGITGDGQYGRRWFVHNQYNGCANDRGWLVLDEPNDPCTWETIGNSSIHILYAPSTTFSFSDAMATGQVFAVFVR